MNRILTGLVLAAFLGLGSVASVQASGGSLDTQAEFEARAKKAEALSERVRRVNSYKEKVAKMRIGQPTLERRGPSLNVPELDPSAAGGALALLIGGALVLADRRKRILSA